MSLDPLGAVQQAIYDRLVTSANKISYPVFDDVTEDYAGDFVEIQAVSSLDNSAKSCPNHICIFFLNCWTIQPQNLLVSQMFNAISQSLTYTDDKTPNPLTVVGFNVGGIYKTGSQINKQLSTSQHKRQGVLELEIHVQEQ